VLDVGTKQLASQYNKWVYTITYDVRLKCRENEVSDEYDFERADPSSPNRFQRIRTTITIKHESGSKLNHFFFY